MQHSSLSSPQGHIYPHSPFIFRYLTFSILEHMPASDPGLCRLDRKADRKADSCLENGCQAVQNHPELDGLMFGLHLWQFCMFKWAGLCMTDALIPILKNNKLYLFQAAGIPSGACVLETQVCKAPFPLPSLGTTRDATGSLEMQLKMWTDVWDQPFSSWFLSRVVIMICPGWIGWKCVKSTVWEGALPKALKEGGVIFKETLCILQM